MVSMFLCMLRSLLTLCPEWFTLMNKDKYSGEVYLELTFWSNVRHLGHFASQLLMLRTGARANRKEEDEGEVGSMHQRYHGLYTLCGLLLDGCSSARFHVFKIAFHAR